MNKSQIIRSGKPFKLITSNILKNNELLISTKALLIGILTNSDKNYVINIINEGKKINIGSSTVSIAKKSIIQAGYLSEKRIKGGMSYIFYEEPNTNK